MLFKFNSWDNPENNYFIQASSKKEAWEKLALMELADWNNVFDYSNDDSEDIPQTLESFKKAFKNALKICKESHDCELVKTIHPNRFAVDLFNQMNQISKK